MNGLCQSELFPTLRVKEPSWFDEFVEASYKKGPFVPQWMIAKALGISGQAVHDFIKRGRLPFEKIGDENFVPVEEARIFIRERLQKTSLKSSR
jgi:hypothetical protein